jgi:dolichol-phosphate mannosyltransferase
MKSTCQNDLGEPQQGAQMSEIDTTDVVLSVVAPVYNESESIVEFSRQLRECLDAIGVGYEVIFVDDGSVDDSRELIEALEWRSARVISFVANAGHQAALDAGYRASRGDFVVCMDSDLQHPPALVPVLLETARTTGVDVVYAVREKRTNDSWFKRRSALAYYRIMHALTDVKFHESAADFRLVSRRVVDVLSSLPAGQQVFRLLIPSLGYPQRTVPYEAAARFAGSSKYTLAKMVGLSVSSVIGFSTKPLTLSIRVGLVVSLLSFAYLIFVLVEFFIGHTVSGWASLLSTLLLVFGVLLVILGVFGLYIGAIVTALQARPPYLIDDRKTGKRGTK